MKKRVLFIMTALNGGGAEKVLVDILHYFDYNQYDVELMLTTTDGVHYKRIPANIKRIILYKTSFLQWIRRLLLWVYRKSGSVFLLRCYLKAITKGMKYDTIVSFMEGEPLLIHSLLLNKGKRHVTWVHTDFVNNHWTRYLYWYDDELKEYQQMHEIVFVSKDAKIQFNQFFYGLKVKQCVIYNLIDVQKIRNEAERFTPHKRKFTIVAVGRLVEAKRFDRLINVCAMMKQGHYDVDTWIIGDGHLRPELEKQILRLGLQENVFLLGFKNPPYPYMKQADLFASTSDVEGYPLVVCEAMILGLPVIATKTTGTMELLGDGKYGVLVEKNEFSIYNGIKLLIESNEQRKHYALRSLERSRCFDIELSMAEIYKVL